MPSETDASGQARSDLPDAVIRAQLERISRATSFLNPNSCGASSRSSSSKDWPGRDIRSKNLSSPMSCTERERTSMAVPIRWTVSMRGASATNCASPARANPIPSSSRCPRAATCPSSKQIPPQPPKRLTWVVLPGRQEPRSVSGRRRAGMAVGALALVAAVAERR